MKSLIAIALLALASPALADDLVINNYGNEQYYTGTIEHIETDGLAGEVVFVTNVPVSYSSNQIADPPLLGIWSVTVRGAKTDAITVAYCYAAYAFEANHGSRLTLNCLPPSSAVKLAR